MRFSKTELKALEQIGNGNRQVSEIAKVLKKSKSQIYRICEKLSEKGMVTIARGVIEPEKKTHVSLLLQILTEFPNLANRFLGTGLKIYMSLLEPKTVAEIEEETKLHRTTIFKELRKGRNISLARQEGKSYKINGRIWPKAKKFLEKLKEYEEVIDNRVPSNAVIYFKNEKEIVFSSKEELDATMTAFSAYKEFGIKLLLITHYYYLPKRKLSKEEICMHSIYVVEKDREIRHMLFLALFYIKYYSQLKKMEHPLLEKIKKVLEGEKIKEFPSLDEIKDRADIYGIRV